MQPRRALIAIALVGGGSALAAPPVEQAELTAVRGEVKVRRLTDDDWTPSERGMALFPAWRVTAADRSSADLTFGDGARARLRPRTTVMIEAPDRRRARAIAAELALEEGALETRVGEAGGRRLVVHTLEAEASMGPGLALIVIDAAGDTLIANHDGGEIEVLGNGVARGRRPVAVPAGLGIKVRKGLPPGRPQRLPSTPAWITAPRAFAALAGRGGRVTVEWTPVDAAAHYRVTIGNDFGEELDTIEVFAPMTRADLGELPAGRYHVAVAAIDPDGFASAPSDELAIEIAAVTVVAPGSRSAIDDAPRGADPILTAGSTLVAPDGWGCTDGNGPSRTYLVLAQPGAGRAITCTGADGSAIEPFVVDVTPLVILADGRSIRVRAGERAAVGLTVSSAGPFGPELQVIGAGGITVVSTTQSGGRLDLELAIAADAPATGSLAIAVDDTPVATIDVAIEPPPVPEPPPKSDVEWTATAEAGLVLSRGNSHTTTATASARAARTDPRHKIAAALAFTYVSSTVLAATDTDGSDTIDEDEIVEVSSTTAESWNATVRYDRQLRPQHALFVAALAGADPPAGKDLVAGGQLGYSHRLVKDEHHEVVAELGYDFSYEDHSSGGQVAIHSARGFAGYRGRINDKTGVETSLEALVNLNALDIVPDPAAPGEDTRLNALASLTTELTRDVAFSFSFGVKFDAVPAPRPAFALPYTDGVAPAADRVDAVAKAALIVSLF